MCDASAGEVVAYSEYYLLQIVVVSTSVDFPPRVKLHAYSEFEWKNVCCSA